ncbi:MAG: exo-alpha-sialidase [bacterium]|nr:exo-alpha-sialidase [bacterium]
MLGLGVVIACSMVSAGEEVYPLWDPSVPFPKASELGALEGVRFSVIKERVPEVDGYNWLHGVALVWHKDTLFTFFGHNKGKENTPTEIAQERRSTNGGRTWGPLRLVASHTETEGRSHGVYLSHEGQLWTFLGRFGAAYANCRAEAFLLDETKDAWVSKGIAAERFWPCDEPRRMEDGNWVMAGMEVVPQGKWAIPAVAISHGEDFTKWDTVTFPVPKEFEGIWGETTVIVTPDELVAVVRSGWKHEQAMVSTSTDCGRTWTPVQWTNLRMPCTKVYGGVLSTGQRYLVGTIVADHNGKRHPLSIAVTKPGEETFSRIFRIRDDVFPEGPGESVEGAALSYPYAVEYEGDLYVGYSNDGNRGRNLNSGEMAVIPVSVLVVE